MENGGYGEASGRNSKLRKHEDRNDDALFASGKNLRIEVKGSKTMNRSQRI